MKTLTLLRLGGFCVWLGLSLWAHLPEACGQPVGEQPEGLLQGLILIEHWNCIRTNQDGTVDPREDVRGVVVESPEFLKRWEPELRRRLGRFMGKPLDPSAAQWLPEVLSNVVQVCFLAGRRLVDVFVPSHQMQNFDAGRVYLVVYEGRVGAVHTRLYQWPVFGRAPAQVTNRARLDRWDQRLPEQLGLKQGKGIEHPKLTQALARLNREPDYRFVALGFVQGTNMGEADVHLTVTNRFPLEAYVGYDNAGNTLIGWDRVFAGAVYHNLWGVGHRLAYQFTADTQFSDYLAHAASYSAPVWCGRHWLTVFGSYADLDVSLKELKPELARFGAEQEGQNVMAGLRYTVLLPELRPKWAAGAYRHEAFAGFDYKRIEATLAFGTFGIAYSAAEYDVAQFVLGYRGLLPDRFGTNRLALQVVASPGGLGDRNSNEAFEQARPGAKARYFYGTVGFGRDTPLGRLPLTWSLSADYQWASDALLASEQLVLGGPGSIRGFEPGVVLGDSGVVVRNELGYHNSWLGEKLTFGGQPGLVRLYAFFDYGINFLAETRGGYQDKINMGSAGGGLRLRWGRHFDGVVEYAVQVIGRDAERRGLSAAEDVDKRVHAFVQFRF